MDSAVANWTAQNAAFAKNKWLVRTIIHNEIRKQKTTCDSKRERIKDRTRYVQSMENTQKEANNSKGICIQVPEKENISRILSGWEKLRGEEVPLWEKQLSEAALWTTEYVLRGAKVVGFLQSVTGQLTHCRYCAVRCASVMYTIFCRRRPYID